MATFACACAYACACVLVVCVLSVYLYVRLSLHTPCVFIVSVYCALCAQWVGPQL
jgi:hypothetical protein